MIPPLSPDGSQPQTAFGIAAAVRAGELDWRAPATRSLDQLWTNQGKLHATITLVNDIQKGHEAELREGPLAGVPLLIKDVIDTAQLRTTYGSSIYRTHAPTADAQCVILLERAGAVVVGKANLHEFAWGLSSQNPHWGNVVNPRNPTLTPGGSSGGNAAAVAAGLVPAGLATDTAGSIRVPAACCDVVGFKPANGTVPMAGVFPLAPSLDCVGPITSTVQDCELLYSVLTGVPAKPPDWRTLAVAATTEELVHRLHQAGVHARLRTQPLPPANCAAILPWEAWRTHHLLVARHASNYGKNVLAKLQDASRVTHSAYAEGRESAIQWRRTEQASTDYDVLVTPTLPCAVPEADMDELAVRDALGRNVRWVNLLGWAAISIGPVQVTGPGNRHVLSVASRLETVYGHGHHPSEPK